MPGGVDAVVTVEGTAVNITAGSGWTESGQKYTQNGSGPTLTILVKMAAGNLVITDLIMPGVDGFEVLAAAKQIIIAVMLHHPNLGEYLLAVDGSIPPASTKQPTSTSAG